MGKFFILVLGILLLATAAGMAGSVNPAATTALADGQCPVRGHYGPDCQFTVGDFISNCPTDEQAPYDEFITVRNSSREGGSGSTEQVLRMLMGDQPIAGERREVDAGEIVFLPVRFEERIAGTPHIRSLLVRYEGATGNLANLSLVGPDSRVYASTPKVESVNLLKISWPYPVFCGNLQMWVMARVSPNATPGSTHTLKVLGVEYDQPVVPHAEDFRVEGEGFSFQVK
ncbi:MAG: hypothetical protein A2748_03800 [Candidatus Wildermuthbacteria bacterium RIFCSPHIGHO2_01_FULL_45_20]|uniref:Uncharacterized protein n=1 Tax=Candidatus Wildermuthbacteria bacterium RIFCSPHIGHO2_02_FULL_45_25 TaxID=1802450 RepID=A0A1G2R2E0_9BACT|nr:MAG: hypothetical protein A2748_03800 [Candidatus Wildermuthbacteria bacterium RIFCSPHIGHO2_01_FULL_45_20]OHA66559.1 MAG: hypothetical protein A3C04_03945 [Candidatus Wildermuthbacteria bacterium RIFCSPHIGHO2_02_FULL_45_25]